MSPDSRVVCIGIATLDAILEVDRLPRTNERVPAIASTLASGGVAATAAVTLGRLGVPVAFIGEAGDDRTGRWIRDDLAAERVDVGGLRLTAGARSALSAVLVERTRGSRALVPDLGDPGRIELDDDDLERCERADWVHLDHLGLDVLPQLRSAGITTAISLDDGVGVATQADLGAVTLDAPTRDILMARHAGLDLDGALDAALELGPRIVAVTRGASGAVAVERRADGGPRRRHAVDGFSVEVRSTLGAGDVFHGALLAGLVDGRPLENALTRAVACAGLSCRSLDGRSAIPSPSELDAAIAAAPKKIEVADGRR
jgi:sulfofructose kinase